MRVREWAKREGFNEQTVWQWCRENRMPVPFERMSTGTIIIHDPKYENRPVTPTANGRTVCYARVSSSDQKDDLQRQADRLKAFALGMGVEKPEIVTETGSGMNDKRRKLNRLLADPTVGTLIAFAETAATAWVAMLAGVGLVLAADRGRRLRVLTVAAATALVSAFAAWPLHAAATRSIRFSTGQGGAAVIHVVLLLIAALGVACLLRVSGRRDRGFGLALVGAAHRLARGDAEIAADAEQGDALAARRGRGQQITVGERGLVGFLQLVSFVYESMI